MKKFLLGCIFIGLLGLITALSGGTSVVRSNHYATWLPPDPSVVIQTATWLPPDPTSPTL